jgi:hypothetical protein
MNEALLKEFTREEVKKALDAIGDLKAPGPDGMPAIFYKQFWDMLGDKVTDEVLAVLNGGAMPDHWNDTVIALIPKVKNPEKVTDLRPISLCNVLYKIISKAITNRLKGILPEIISPNQSAFVPGRLISDNILVAYEMTHYLRRKRRGDRARNPTGETAERVGMRGRWTNPRPAPGRRGGSAGRGRRRRRRGMTGSLKEAGND